MTTPRIEEILAKFRSDFPYTYDQVSEDNMKETHETFLRKALTEARQAGRDEAVEIIKSMKRDQDAPKEGDPHFTGCGGCGGDYPAICGCKEVNQALDDTIKALQNNK